MPSIKPKFATCRHIKTDGHVCQSPAIRGTSLCFFHGKIRHTHRRPKKVETLTSYWQEAAIESEGGGAEDDIFAVDRSYPHQNEIEFPPLEDGQSVQLATSMLFQAIATGNVNFKRARLLLYTLKIAAINLRVTASQARSLPDTSSIPTNIVRTAEGHILAAPEEDPAAAQLHSAAPQDAERASPSPTEPEIPDLDAPPAAEPELATEPPAELDPDVEPPAELDPEAPPPAEPELVVEPLAEPEPDALLTAEPVFVPEVSRDFSPGIPPPPSLGALAPGESSPPTAEPLAEPELAAEPPAEPAPDAPPPAEPELATEPPAELDPDAPPPAEPEIPDLDALLPAEPELAVEPLAELDPDALLAAEPVFVPKVSRDFSPGIPSPPSPGALAPGESYPPPAEPLAEPELAADPAALLLAEPELATASPTEPEIPDPDAPPPAEPELATEPPAELDPDAPLPAEPVFVPKVSRDFSPGIPPSPSPGALAPGESYPPPAPALNPSENRLLDITLVDRGFYVEPQQLCL